MCQNCLKPVCDDPKDALELNLALECAPLLSGLRIANIINISREEFWTLTMVLADTALSTVTVADIHGRIFLLLYRENAMREYLRQSEVRKLLQQFGYPVFGEMHLLLQRFSKRYQAYLEGTKNFPHEMGLFLGYPVEDVRGFLENNGKNYLAVGYWKVYQNKREKTQLFAKFEEAKEGMLQMIAMGMNLKEAAAVLCFGRNIIGNAL